MASGSEGVLETAAGALRGQRVSGMHCYRAIPYAAAPVGALRFSPPQPAQRWAGVRDATRPGPVAPQTPSRLREVMGDFERAQAEDCLTLTVWTPGADAQRRPVLVWLHGGAFMTGGGDLPWYDGGHLAREGDVVVVAVNYRLGALGFLRAAGVSPGNLGLLDQRLALQWVQQHIAAFGGDAAQVTLMGQSAGALSAALALTAHEPPPVQRALLMSAPLGLAPVTVEQAERVGEAYLRALGLDPQAATVGEQVRRLPLPELMRAQAAAGRFHAEQLARPGDAAPPFLPVADGATVPSPGDHPAALRGAAASQDVLIGTTRDEAVAFAGADAGMTEQMFAAPSSRWAEHAAQAGRQAHLYRFDWAPPGGQAPHCIELPFVFGTRAAFADAPMLAGAAEADIDALSARLRAHWLAFVRTGNPNADGHPPWPACSATRAACQSLPASPGDGANLVFHPTAQQETR